MGDHVFKSIDRFQIIGRGTVFTMHLPRDYSREELASLPGKEVIIDGRKYTCRGVETYAIWVETWKANTHPIGLCVGDDDGQEVQD